VKCLKNNRQEGIRLIQESVKYDLARVNTEVAVDVWSGSSKSKEYYNLAAAYAYLGEQQKALQYLDTATAHGVQFEWGYKHDPFFDELRTDSRFQVIIQKPLSHWDFVASSLRKALDAQLPVD
jgi:hypothetical protein